MGLGRKDESTRSFHKNGWIPAFAGMTGVGFRGNGGVDVRDACSPAYCLPGQAPQKQ